MTFDAVLMVDWTGGGDTGPTPKKDAIWMARAAGGHADAPEYVRNRLIARDRLAEEIQKTLDAGERLMIGFDFPFGYPQGFARHITGSDDPFALWQWITDRAGDLKDGKNRFDLAAQMNALLPGDGPFWFNGIKREIDGLSRKKPPTLPVTELRKAETLAKGAFTCWQMGGAGAVGSQVLMGLPILQSLRAMFPDQIAVWPFEPLDRPIAFIEIWPSLIAAEVAANQQPDEIKDAAQVRTLAAAVSRLSPTELEQMLDVHAPKEGWIFGLGHEQKLAAAARQGRLRNDCFALPPGTHWTPVDEAMDMLRDRLTPVTGTETIPAHAAGGRILAKDAIAAGSHPPHANSAVDGYGFAGGLTPGLHHIPLAAGRAAAGVPWTGTLPQGQALRILTGAPLPDGVDTVVLEEDVRATETEITVEGPLKPGANTRKAGEDVVAGDITLPAGRRLTAPDLALLSSTAIKDVTVHRPLRVGILSTGDEVQPPGAPLAPGQIADANRPMLAEVIRKWGYEVVDLGIARDDRGDVENKLNQGASQADVILTSGGASAGDEDHVSALLRGTGSMALWRIAVKPGRPLALAVWNGAPVFGLPGNPVAAFVCTLIFARPALSALAGAGWSEPIKLTVPAAFSKNKKPGRREYLRARLTNGCSEVFGSEGSGRVSGLSWADGLVELPDGAAVIEPGTPVTYMPFAGFGL